MSAKRAQQKTNYTFTLPTVNKDDTVAIIGALTTELLRRFWDGAEMTPADRDRLVDWFGRDLTWLADEIYPYLQPPTERERILGVKAEEEKNMPPLIPR